MTSTLTSTLTPVQHRTTVAALQSILGTAIDGISYWAPSAASVEWNDNGAAAIVGLVVCDVDAEDFDSAVEAKPITFSGGWGGSQEAVEVARIDHKVIRKGLGILLALIKNGTVHPRSEIGQQVRDLLAEGEIDAADATVADAILQCGLFGEVVFG